MHCVTPTRVKKRTEGNHMSDSQAERLRDNLKGSLQASEQYKRQINGKRKRVAFSEFVFFFPLNLAPVCKSLSPSLFPIDALPTTASLVSDCEWFQLARMNGSVGQM